MWGTTSNWDVRILAYQKSCCILWEIHLSAQTLSPETVEFINIHNIEEGPLLLEMIDMQASWELTNTFKREGCTEFWVNCVSAEKFPMIRKLTVYVLTMFSSTYTCESSFSHVNSIKTSNRASLSDNHLQNCLRMALISYEPNFSAFAQSRKCNLSH